MTSLRHALLVCLALCASGCVTHIGRAFVPDRPVDVVLGATTGDELRARLGAPTHFGAADIGARELWVYDGSRWFARDFRLVIADLDARGVVRSLRVFGNGWAAGPDFEAAARIEPGRTTAAAVRVLLGEPRARIRENAGPRASVAWDYAFARDVTFVGEPVAERSLTIVFDADGRVRRTFEVRDPLDRPVVGMAQLARRLDGWYSASAETPFAGAFFLQVLFTTLLAPVFAAAFR